MLNRLVLPLLCIVIVYARIKPINEDDPELYQEWRTPSDLSHYRTYKQGAGFLGNLFAGRAEFPWIVDVRHADGDVESWTTGNLITSNRVLVSCRAIGTWKKNHDSSSFPDKFIKFVDIKVSYCTTYLWEDYKLTYYRKIVPEDDRSRNTDTGTRYVREAVVHTLCSPTSLAYDIGWLKLAREIRVISPVIDYMSIWFDPTTLRVSNVDLSRMNEQGRVCYIASFGRDYVNYVDHYVIDYKVKYRVYYEPMSNCRREQRTYARTDPSWSVEINSQEERLLYCFKSRAPVGTVCDHDKAAPLVCDDRVYGWVVRGAQFSNCNNRMQLTFLVVRAQVLDEYYRNLVKSGPGARSTAAIPYACFFTLLFFLSIIFQFSH